MKHLIKIFPILIFLIPACKKMLQIDPPKSQVETGIVFSDDAGAVAAVYGMYTDFFDVAHFASGSPASVTALAGLTADELVDYSQQNIVSLQFESNNISPANTSILSLWASLFKTIYQANSALEGIEKSTGMTTAARTQLRGECLLVRAWAHFYLTNLFGNAPLVLSTDYEKNALIPRSSIDQIYNSVINDLTEAISLLSEQYLVLDDDFFTPSRAKPNKSAAQALLARVYLFRNEWVKAEELASAVIAKTDTYELLPDLTQVFLKNSREAIWQFQPTSPLTNEAFYFINFNQGFSVLSKRLVQSFENNDKRKIEWIRETAPGDSVFYAYKYRQGDFAGPLLEYSMIIRFAEMFLIRAEARAHQNNLPGAIEDIDKLRGRASLTLIEDDNPGIDKDNLLLAIERERRAELFTEWGHRWFDLKRTGRSNAVLSPIKSLWQNSDTLYPIPASEFVSNPALGNQNAGY